MTSTKKQQKGEAMLIHLDTDPGTQQHVIECHGDPTSSSGTSGPRVHVATGVDTEISHAGCVMREHVKTGPNDGDTCHFYPAPRQACTPLEKVALPLLCNIAIALAHS